MEAAGLLLWAMIAWYWIWPDSFGRQIGRVVHNMNMERLRLAKDELSGAQSERQK